MIPIWRLSGRLGNQMFRHAYIYSQMKDGDIPDIYVQGEEYFEKYADEIKQMYGEGIGYTDRVSIHVRRGDYVGSDFHLGLWMTDYYEKAVAMFPDDRFIVFCQDRLGSEQDAKDQKWCREYFTKLLGDRFEIREGTDEIDDMNLMASCKHNIIANSSFSWWAAYLNPNPDKIVVAPVDWYYDGQTRTTCPKSWKRI